MPNRILLFNGCDTHLHLHSEREFSFKVVPLRKDIKLSLLKEKLAPATAFKFNMISLVHRSYAMRSLTTHFSESEFSYARAMPKTINCLLFPLAFIFFPFAIFVIVSLLVSRQSNERRLYRRK
jgi:hypothetical protein